MTQVAIYNEKGTLIGNSLRALGPWESGLDIPDSVKQGICDQLNGMKARGELDVADAEIPGPDMASLKEEASLRARVESGGQEAEKPAHPKKPIVIPLETEGTDGQPVTWYPCRMDFSSELRVGMLTVRNGSNQLDLTDLEVLRSFTAALLFCGLHTSEQDDRPHFESYEAAYTFVVDPDHKEIVAELFNATTAANPGILPGKKN